VVVGFQEHDTPIAPPEAESNDPSEKKAADSEKEPMLAHLRDISIVQNFGTRRVA
jgi:hypothetical protein